MIDIAQIRHRLQTWKAMEERAEEMHNRIRSNDKGEEDQEGRCFNPLCEHRWAETYFSNERIGWQCDCGGTIWHKDEYTEKEVTNERR